MPPISIFFLLLGLMILLFALFIQAKGKNVLKHRFGHLPAPVIDKIVQFIARFWLLYSQIWIVFAVVFGAVQQEMNALFIALGVFVVLNIVSMLYAWQKVKKMMSV